MKLHCEVTFLNGEHGCGKGKAGEENEKLAERMQTGSIVRIPRN